METSRLFRLTDFMFAEPGVLRRLTEQDIQGHSMDRASKTTSFAYCLSRFSGTHESVMADLELTVRCSKNLHEFMTS